MGSAVTEVFANKASTTLNNGSTLTATATSVTVTDASTFPLTGNFRVLIGSEIIKVTAASGNVFTLVRGQEGTTAASHSDGVAITHVLTSGAVQSLQQNRALFTNTGASIYPIDGASPMISGLSFWLRPDLGLTLSGSTATTWVDQASGYSLTNSGTPTYSATGGPNGQPGIAFNRSNPDYLHLASGTTNVTTGSGSSTVQTVFVVHKATSATPGNAQNSCQVNEAIAAFNQDVANARTMILTLVQYIDDAGSSITTNWEVWDMTVNMAAQTFRVNGTQKATGTGTPGTHQSVTVGSSDSYANGFTGSVAEVVGFKTNLSADERYLIGTYLRNRYNIAITGLGSPFDELILHNKSGAVTYLLPPPTAGRQLEIRDITGAINTLANNVFIVPNAGDKINTSSGFALTGTSYHFTNGSATVTATSSKFQSELAVGMSIASSNQSSTNYVVTAIASDTSLTIATIFTGSTTTTATAKRTSLTFAANNGKLFIDSDGTDWYISGDGTPTVLTWTASSGGSVAPFISPQGVTFAEMTGFGGGGGGGSGANTTNSLTAGGAGGGGALQTTVPVTITAVTNYAIAIGAGGAGGTGATAASAGTSGSPGADSTVGSVATFGGASGGSAGTTNGNDSGGGLPVKSDTGTTTSSNLNGVVDASSLLAANANAFIATAQGGFGGGGAGTNGTLGARNPVGGSIGGTGGAGNAVKASGGGGGGAGPNGAGGNGSAGVASGAASAGSAASANTGAGGGGSGVTSAGSGTNGAGGNGGSGQVTIKYVL